MFGKLHFVISESLLFKLSALTTISLVKGQYFAYFSESELSVNAISLVNSTVDFGQVSRTATYSTAGPLAVDSPFIVQNDGNLLLNVTVNSTPLFAQAQFPDEAYSFKANYSGREVGAFNFGNSTTSWTYFNSVHVPAFVYLQYVNSSDEGALDVQIRTPEYEPTGNKTTGQNVVFSSAMGES